VKKFGTALIATLLLGSSLSFGAVAQTVAVGTDKDDKSKYIDAKGEPIYKKFDDGSFDWYTFNGFRRYHAECHVCHGPEGKGSTYAPALADSLKTMGYGDFVGVVASGRIVELSGGAKSVMPALGDNKNVMCYVDDIFVYLKARAEGALPGGRPKREVERSQASQDYENSCLKG